MTQIIVPTDTPGLHIVRGIPVWGRDSDHCEIIYDNVRVPLANQLGQTGSGHQAAQDRLGAGRVFHCMNSIGQMWRAFDLMVERAADARGARRQARDQAVHAGLHRRLVHRHPGRAPDDDPLRRAHGRRRRPAHRHLRDQDLRARGLRARRRPRDPGLGRGGRVGRSAARRACTRARARCASPTARTRCTRS